MIMNYEQDNVTLEARTDDNLSFVISDINFTVTAYPIEFKFTNGRTVTDLSHTVLKTGENELSVSVTAAELSELIVGNIRTNNRYTIVADLGNGSAEFILGGVLEIKKGI